ncbi:hypothetical protein ATANTOWER_016892, partial [Ataeniobius toweri]|nr:hypothetical protein [Ataeniobius toweri]
RTPTTRLGSLGRPGLSSATHRGLPSTRLWLVVPRRLGDVTVLRIILLLKPSLPAIFAWVLCLRGTGSRVWISLPISRLALDPSVSVPGLSSTFHNSVSPGPSPFYWRDQTPVTPL